MNTPLSRILSRARLHGAIAVFVGSLAAAPAQAEGFNGHWIANQGKLTLNIGYSMACTKIEIRATQVGERFTLEKYAATCGLINPDFGPWSVDIRGEQVFKDGEVIGSLRDGILLTTHSVGTTDYAINLKLIPSTPTTPAILRSYYGVRTGSGAAAVEGDHQLAP